MTQGANLLIIIIKPNVYLKKPITYPPEWTRRVFCFYRLSMTLETAVNSFHCRSVYFNYIYELLLPLLIWFMFVKLDKKNIPLWDHFFVNWISALIIFVRKKAIILNLIKHFCFLHTHIHLSQSRNSGKITLSLRSWLLKCFVSLLSCEVFFLHTMRRGKT